MNPEENFKPIHPFERHIAPIGAFMPFEDDMQLYWVPKQDMRWN